MNKFLSAAAALVMAFGASIKADAVYNYTSKPVTVSYKETIVAAGTNQTFTRNSTYTIGSGGNQGNPNTSIPNKPVIQKGKGTETITQRGRDWFIN